LNPANLYPHSMISQFYLASIHPECFGSVGNALRQCLGTRVALKKLDPEQGFKFERSDHRQVACFVDIDGFEGAQVREILQQANESGIASVIVAEDIEAVPTDLIDAYRVWTCIRTVPEGRFRHSIQSVALDLINFQMLNEVENSIRSGPHRTTRNF
ncbi:MAG: hypothetical protein AAGB06_06565, partial [Verrucomicrobiota bacterium]